MAALSDFRMQLLAAPTVYAFTRHLDGVTLLGVANAAGEFTAVALLAADS